MPVTTDLPVVQPQLIIGEVRALIRKRADTRGDAPSVLLLRAVADWTGDETLKVSTETGEHTVRIRPARSVLGVIDAIASRGPDELLVVLSPFQEADLGPNVLAQVVEQRVFSLGLWDVLTSETGAERLDPLLRSSSYRWLAEAVLGNAELLRQINRNRPTVLRVRDLLERLAAHRLGFGSSENVDPATLLTWTRRPQAFVEFTGLPAEERAGITAHLAETVGPVAELVLSLADPDKRHAGKLVDAVPLGLVLEELYADQDAAPKSLVHEARIRLERFLPDPPPSDATLLAYARVCAALTERWSEGSDAEDAEAMYERAAAILAELKVAPVAEYSRVLPAGFQRRLEDLAKAMATARNKPGPKHLDAAEAAYRQLNRHRLSRATASVPSAAMEAARSAMRLLRWLSTEPSTIRTLAEGITWQVREGGWADRAIRVLASTDTGTSSAVARAYKTLFTAARERRAAMDEQFARRLAAWTSRESEEMLLAENIMQRIARPVTTRSAPLIVVVDGMSAADAVAIAEDVVKLGGWVEAGREGSGREGALATIPSMTVYSRTSLLTGTLTSGGQKIEDAGFATFWKGRPARLFHKDELRAEPGRMIPEDLREAVHEPKTVVGVVLNTIDDALATDERIDNPLWTLGTIDYFTALMREASTAGRPVIITSDHGHIRDYGGSVTVKGDSARFRAPGTPAGRGEILLDGPRVLHGDGRIIAAFDENVRYRMRKAGYHGGASLAEMIIPVLVFLPTGMSAPNNWESFNQGGYHEPVWWNKLPPVTVAPTDISGASSEDALFGTDILASASAESLGSRIRNAGQFTAQLALLRQKPSVESITAVINGLDAAGGRLPVASVAELAGVALFRIDGYISLLTRVLNLDGYPVLSRTDGGRTLELNRELLIEQFLGGAR